ncbi:MAG TPA: site-2 protease family protein [Gemmatimonadaceae bacterium]|jgi:Zn-dependent protease|nr:site-2 protease family protein [Gemmatimonadaceae bacterium]
MRWSLRLGHLAGIALYVHVTFLLLLAWVALLAWRQGDGARAALGGVLYVLAIFAIVVLHELGHALTARRYGIVTRDIVLLPIGGVARLERMPEEPRAELAIAVAGPMVNVVLAALCYALLRASGGTLADASVATTGHSWLASFTIANLVLAGFNILPAFPMDGGRVLRALLSMRVDRTRATEIAARVGQGFALLFGLYALLAPNFLLLFIALFVWMGAQGEAAAVQGAATLAGVPVSQVMITDLRTLSPDAPLRAAVDHVLAGFQQDFPVVEQGRVVGVLTRAALLRALSRDGPEAAVATAMERDFASADPREPVERALERLRRGPDRTIMPVLREGELVGVLTAENVGEFLLVQSALDRRTS